MHQQYLRQRCRFCIGDVSNADFKYKLSNIKFQELLTKYYEGVPNFDEEDDAKYPKYICNILPTN